MPLPRPRPRKLIHTREIFSRGYEREDGLWDIEASLVDSKAYSFDNIERDGINAGEPIHHMLVRLSVNAELEVREVAVAIDAGPFLMCGDVAPNFERLVGLRIGPGWRKAVRPARSKREQAAAKGKKPVMLDTCHALASDSDVVKRHWPDFYTGASDG